MASTIEPLDTTEKQPKALYILFFAELWERFSFYGMKALLILYMIKELAFGTEASYGILGAYGALLYASNILGGFLADNFLGNRRAVMYGSAFIIAGHLSLALPFAESSFYYGLALLVVGTGFFKPNISSFLGLFYKKNDHRRDSGFTIFYMGINIGGLLAPLVCGTIADIYGWHYGFGIAALGMVFGAIAFYGGSKSFENIGLPPCQDALDRPILLGLSMSKLIFIGASFFVFLVVTIIQNHEYMGGFMAIASLAVLTFMLFIAFRSPLEERKCILTLLAMFFFMTCFISIWEQIGGSILLFTEASIDRQVFGYTVPASWSQSLNPLFIILMSPFVSSIWKKTSKAGKNISTPIKFSIGFLFCALGFYAFVLGIQSHQDGVVALKWLLLGVAGFSLGELFISPVGLSTVTKLAPAKQAGLLMGVFFFSFGLASFLAQWIAQFFGTPNTSGETTDIMAQLQGFENIFTFVAQFSLVSAVLALLITPLVSNVFKRHN